MSHERVVLRGACAVVVVALLAGLVGATREALARDAVLPGGK